MHTPSPARLGTASVPISSFVRLHPNLNTSSNRFVFSFILFSLLSLFGLAGCGDQKVAVEETSAQAIPASGVQRVIVQNFNGKVDVFNDTVDDILLEVTRVGVGGTQTEAQLDLESIDVQVKQKADTLSILARDLDDKVKNGAEARLVLRLPVEVRLNVTNGVGEINFWGVHDRGKYSFQTGSGSIHIYLPEDASLQISALAGNGKIDSDFLVIPTIEGSRNILNGATDESPGIAITASTSNGDIGIHCSR